MKSLHVLAVVAVLSLFGVAQQSNPVSTPTSSQVVVPRLIRFSGQLKSGTGTVGITFTLHKSQQDEASLWTETQSVKLDGTGKYTVLLGATKSDGMPVDLFTSGEAQWLGIHIEGQPEQRVLLVSVPYALKAAEAETLAGHSAAEFVTSDKLRSAVKDQLQQTATTSASGSVKKNSGVKGNVLSSTATNFTDTTNNQVVLVTQNGTGSAITATTAGTGNGVTGTANAPTGIGVAGINNAATGVPIGLRGSTVADSGISIYGTATGTGGSATGVKGISAAPLGYGVFGQNTATTGPGIGFRGTTASTSGIGIYGTSTAVTGNTVGLRTSVASPNGTSAIFQNSASGKIISGQSGAGNTEVFSLDGGGNIVSGAIAATTKSGKYGVYGQQNALSAEYAACCTTYSAGVWGDTTSVSTAILATADNANGIQANNNSASYAAGYFQNDYASGTGFVLVAAGATGNCNIYTNGNLTCTGTVSSPYPAANQRTLEMYGVHATENWYEDAGSSSLSGGTAHVRFDPNFMEAVNTSVAYQVFLTPKGDCKGLYVSNEGPDGFEVHELGGGHASIAFDYRIMAKRKGQETLRMADITDKQKKLSGTPNRAGAAQLDPQAVLRSTEGQQ